MSTPRLHPQAQAFIDYLQRYRNDRGALAHLRGALSEARRANAWPLLAPFPGALGNPAFETAAALWAGGPELTCEAGNLGTTLAILKADRNSFENRFKRLLACDRDEITARVGPVVRAAQARGVRLNYAQLHSDLLYWNDRVKTEWAKAFWGAAEPDETINPALLDAEPGEVTT